MGGSGWRWMATSRLRSRLVLGADDLRHCGEVPERSNGAVSKTVVPLTGDRGFESLPLRHFAAALHRRSWRVARHSAARREQCEGGWPPLQLIRRLALIPGRVTCRSPLRGGWRGQRLSYHRKLHRPESTAAPAWSSYPTAAGPVLPGSAGSPCCRTLPTGDVRSFRGGGSKPEHAGAPAALPR